jgi:hypothetical protein
MQLTCPFRCPPPQRIVINYAVRALVELLANSRPLPPPLQHSGSGQGIAAAAAAGAGGGGRSAGGERAAAAALALANGGRGGSGAFGLGGSPAGGQEHPGSGGSSGARAGAGLYLAWGEMNTELLFCAALSPLIPHPDVPPPTPESPPTAHRTRQARPP